MVTDGAALSLAAFSAWLAARPPSHRHSYGWDELNTGGLDQCDHYAGRSHRHWL
ncbi:hypothetical protein [Brenneria uluponensis]|uniref:hypothetical protein n=1 Tax=Brenneria uluponensis TaxID=3057057 RepID=UPI003CCC8C43